MHSVVHAGMIFLETLFIVGWAGAIIVVLISGVEDLKTIFTKEDTQHGPIEG